MFYQEFIRYTGGDGKALGIVLTPTHLTEFMAKAVGVTKSDRVLDTCCGSASFLVTCMGMMYGQASEEEREGIRSSHRFGIVQPRGKVACIVPTSCALGKKHVEVRKHLMLHHRLDAVFSMPDDLFYPTGVTTCVMVWEAHCPHDEKRTTFFGYCKDDGHVKVKNLGRVDRYSRWHDIEARWLQLYAERAVEPGATRTGKPWRGTCARCPMPRSCHEDPASGWHR